MIVFKMASLRCIFTPLKAKFIISPLSEAEVADKLFLSDATALLKGYRCIAIVWSLINKESFSLISVPL